MTKDLSRSYLYNELAHELIFREIPEWRKIESEFNGHINGKDISYNSQMLEELFSDYVALKYTNDFTIDEFLTRIRNEDDDHKEYYLIHKAAVSTIKRIKLKSNPLFINQYLELIIKNNDQSKINKKISRFTEILKENLDVFELIKQEYFQTVKNILYSLSDPVLREIEFLRKN